MDSGETLEKADLNGEISRNEQRRQNHCRRANRIYVDCLRGRLHEPSSSVNFFDSVSGGDGDRKKDGPMMPKQTRAKIKFRDIDIISQGGKKVKEDNMKKFELTTNTKMFLGRKLFQIKALVSFGDVKEGDLGGYIEKEGNLDHDGNAWVSGDACVFGDAWVYGDADYATVKGFGRKFRNTTFFRCKDSSIKVVCGCFLGTLQEFREKVKDTHKNSKMGKEYLMIADLMELHFKEEKDV